MSASTSSREQEDILALRSLSWRDWLRTLSVLFKARVVSLLLAAAVGGAFLGAGGWPGLGRLLLVLATGFLAAGGASALNQYLERGSDGHMGRTRNRPLVNGVISASRQRWIPLLALVMIALPSLAVYPFLPALSFYLLLGAFIYVVIYTIWLKPRTLLNIVIGGAAGSAAVMCGGAAVGAENDPAVITLALLVFLWTPSHFWSLAILYRHDYTRVGTPMLPTYLTLRHSALWVLLHSVGTGLAALLLAVTPALGWVYLLLASLATVDLMRRNLQLLLDPTPVRARRFFITSNVYLLVILIAVCLDVLLPF